MWLPHLRWSAISMAAALLAMSGAQSLTYAQERTRTTQPMNSAPYLTGSIRVSPAPKAVAPITVDKDWELFGRTIPDQSLMIDQETGAVANVFVWVTSDSVKAQSKARHSSSQLIALAHGNLAPRASVVKVGDELEYRCLSPSVADSISIEGLGGPFFVTDKKGVSIKLKRSFDLPVRLESKVYPWLIAWVFIEDDSRCDTTNRAGRFKLADIKAGKVRIHMWHERFGRPRIDRVLPTARIVGPGEIEVEVKDKSLDVGEVVLATPGSGD